MEDENFRLEHKIPRAPLCYLTTIQSKGSHIPCSLHPKAYKICLKTIEEFTGFEHEPPIFLAWSYKELFSAPNSDIFSLYGFTVPWAHELVFVTRGDTKVGS